MIEILPDNEVRFSFWTPLEKTVDRDDERRLISGVASTEEKDGHGEILLQKGIDCDWLMNHGVINWNHQDMQRPGAIIGVPIEYEKRTSPPALWVAGELHKGLRDADDAYALIKYYEANPQLNRRLGWSVQGRARRNRFIVVKSEVRHLALTNDPALGSTYAMSGLLKAMDLGLDSLAEREMVDYTGGLRKEMTTGSAEPVLLENLAGQRGVADLFKDLFFGDSPVHDLVFDDDGRFHAGPTGMHRQLVAKGMDAMDAKDLVVRLYKSMTCEVG